jgi:cell division protein YceG involved in septum cleavage
MKKKLKRLAALFFVIILTTGCLVPSETVRADPIRTVSYGKTTSYSNPFKTLKIGSKDLASKFKKSRYANHTPKAESEKITVKLKSGWKLKSITHTYYVRDENEDIDGDAAEAYETWTEKTDTIKNKGTIKYQEEEGTLVIKVYNKKIKKHKTFQIYLKL